MVVAAAPALDCFKAADENPRKGRDRGGWDGTTDGGTLVAVVVVASVAL